MWPFLIPPPFGQPHSAFGGTSACWLFLCFHYHPYGLLDLKQSINQSIRTMTWTTGSLTCVYIYTHTRGVGHTGQRVSTTFLTRKNSKFCLCSWRDSNHRPLSNAVTTEPSRHPESTNEFTGSCSRQSVVQWVRIDAHWLTKRIHLSPLSEDSGSGANQNTQEVQMNAF